MKVEIETEATQFLEQENVNGIFVAVCQLVGTVSREKFFLNHIFFCMNALVLTIIWCLIMEKIKFKVSACFYEKNLLILRSSLKPSS